MKKYLNSIQADTCSLHDGYNFAYFLKKNKILNNIKISLTTYFYRIQEVLGFSVTDAYEKNIYPSQTLVDPIWGKPDASMLCDVFVIMPFSDALTPVFEDHIFKVCEGMDLTCKRADLVFDSVSIIKDIWSLTYNAKVIICDCTEKNPNVFYELGIAHTLGKKTICITQNQEDIPFDIKHLRYIKYEYTRRGMEKFEETLKKYML